MRTGASDERGLDRNGIEAVMIGAVCLMIALVAGVGADSSLARFFTGVLVGLAIVAIGAGLWTVRRSQRSSR